MKQLFAILFCSMLLLGTSASAEEAGLWEKSSHTASRTTSWIAEKSSSGWQSFTHGISTFASWSASKSKQAWEATKDGAHATMQWGSDTLHSIHGSSGRQPRADITHNRTS